MCKVVVCTALVLIASTIGPNPVAAQGPPGPIAVRIVDPLPLPVADAGSPIRSPFQATLCLASGTFSCQELPAILTVPGDVRLVIEFVSFQCGVAGDTATPPRVTAVALTTTVATSRVRHFFVPVTTQAGNTSSDSLGSQSTKLYADPGTAVRLEFSTVASNRGSCVASISGYTIAP